MKPNNHFMSKVFLRKTAAWAVAVMAVALSALDASAAHMVVRNMQLLKTDQTAINPETSKKDQNGQTAAVIKVYTNNINAAETFFEGGQLGIVERVVKPGQIWLYVPPRSQYLKVVNQKFEPYNWIFSEEILPGKTYSAILTVEGKEVTLSAQVKNAPLYVDGDSVGQSPQNVYIPYGEHYVTARSGSHVGEIAIQVTPEGPARFEIPMEDENLKYSDVTVSVPDNADIYFEGKRVGLGEWHTKLKEGTYSVEFRKPDHEDGVKRFTVSAGVPTVVKGDALVPYRGYLNVVVIPNTGVRILSGDTLAAMHRLEKHLPIGKHIYTFEKKGYWPQTKSFTVARDVQTDDTVTLQRIQYIRSNDIYVGIGVGYGANLGAGIHVGINISNVNIEVGYTLGLSKGNEVLWFEKNLDSGAAVPGLYVGKCAYTVDALEFKAGYQLSFVQRVGLTPQVGYLGQRLRGGEWGNGAMCHNLSIGARLVVNPLPMFGVFVNPEYAVPVKVNDLYDSINTFGGPVKGGFYVSAGIEFNFGL